MNPKQVKEWNDAWRDNMALDIFGKIYCLCSVEEQVEIEDLIAKRNE